MKINRILIRAVLVVLVVAVAAEAGEVRAMVAVGVLDFGEDAKVVSVYDFNKYRSNYEDFQKLLKKSATMADMARGGWTIVHMAGVRDEYHLVIYESGIAY